MVLRKAYVQFDERNKKIESGYISDLRQYCRIITTCEEQLIMNLVPYNLQFFGELIKSLSGYHLMVVNNLLNWIQQFEFYLTPSNSSTPFQQLLDQSMKYKHRYISLKESGASSQMDDIHRSFQSLIETNTILLDKCDVSRLDETLSQNLEQQSRQVKVDLRSNTKQHTKLLINKLINKQKQQLQYIRIKSQNMACSQTDLSSNQIEELENQNRELQLLLQTTIDQYENKIKYYKVQYHDSKLILKAQKYKILHQEAVQESQQQLIKQLFDDKQIEAKLSNKQFQNIETLPERNKRLSRGSLDKLTPLMSSQSKLRSNSLPKIDINIESQMRKSFQSIGSQVTKNTIQSNFISEVYTRYQYVNSFKQQLTLICKQSGVTLPENLETNDKDEFYTRDLKIMVFQKAINVLLEKHTLCHPKCPHLGFLNDV